VGLIDIQGQAITARRAVMACFHNFWHTSTTFYSEHIYLFHVSQVYHTMWCHLVKIND